MRSTLAVVSLCLVLTSCTARQVSGAASKLSTFASRPLVAAHRAEHFRHSENSLEAIEASVKEEIPLIEIDIRESSEGIPFLFHDKKIQDNSLVSPKALVGRGFSSLTSSEIQSITLPKGDQVARLDDVICAVRNSNSAFILDVKGDAPLRDKILASIESCGSQGAYWFLCYSKDCIAQVSDRGEQINFIARIGSELSMAEALLFDPKIIQIDCDTSCQKDVLEIKSRLPNTLILSKSLWPVKDGVETWSFLVQEGIDIILTDNPLILQAHFPEP